VESDTRVSPGANAETATNANLPGRGYNQPWIGRLDVAKESFMRRILFGSLALAVPFFLVGLIAGQHMAAVRADSPGMSDQHMSGMKMGTSATPVMALAATSRPIAAADVGNTVCPVTGEKVLDSKAVEIYDGKVYHFCCSDCNEEFEKDPAKFAKAVAADPAKYGIKP